MQITSHQLFIVWFWIGFVFILWAPLSWLLLSIFTPKSVLDKYFKEPYFTLTETVLMAQFPGFLMRTAMFGWALLIPSIDKKRKLKDLEKYIPRWYALALKVFILGVAITMTLFLSLLAIMLLMIQFDLT